MKGDNEKRDKYIENLLGKMTLEEKIGQMNQVQPKLKGEFEPSFSKASAMWRDGEITDEQYDIYWENAEYDYNETLVRQGLVGSFTLLYGAEKINHMQRIAVNESRLGIPLLFGFDAIHGVKTIFPIPLAESCSWNRDLFKKTAQITAVEAREVGVNWTFSPMVDIGKDARWGRICETAGEDPMLVGEYANCKVIGYQGNKLGNEGSIIACAKHFVGYGEVEGGIDYNSVDISMQKLLNNHIRPFIKAINAGVATVMSAFTDINGIPCTMNKQLLKEILRDDFDFEGVVLSDWNAVAECVTHGICNDSKEAAVLALEAGIDIDMVSQSYNTFLKDCVEEKLIDETYIDDAVRRILKLKYDMGVFHNPYVTNCDTGGGVTIREEFRQLAREAAKESIVLLKNDNNVLPLNKTTEIILMGDYSFNAYDLLGAWSYSGEPNDAMSIYDSLKKEMNNVYTAKDNDFSCLRDSKIEYAVITVGEGKKLSGEAASRSNIEISNHDKELIIQAKRAGKKIIVLLINGRPLAIPWLYENVDAILECWQLGTEAGGAIAEILLGKDCPCGKLTTTFPYNSGQCPTYYNHLSTGKPYCENDKYSAKYQDVSNRWLFPFGYGMSYTTFEYSDMNVFVKSDSIEIVVTIKNIGKCSGKEIVQFYFRDNVASIARPVKQLIDFTKIKLEVGEHKIVKVSIAKKNLGFYNNEKIYTLENGWFIFMAGKSSEECIEKGVYVTF